MTTKTPAERMNDLVAKCTQDLNKQAQLKGALALLLSIDPLELSRLARVVAIASDPTPELTVDETQEVLESLTDSYRDMSPYEIAVEQTESWTRAEWREALNEAIGDEVEDEAEDE